MRQKNLIFGIVTSLFLFHCAHAPQVPGYARCPDKNQYPGLACCKKDELFAPHSGGCTKPENISPEAPKEPSKELPKPVPTPPPQAVGSAQTGSAQLSSIIDQTVAKRYATVNAIVGIFGCLLGAVAAPAGSRCEFN